ncbi:MAG: serpin family protein [Cystobacterineae bacterium]|nr:serpin family protein [Cystobacterineae bacterium]
MHPPFFLSTLLCLMPIFAFAAPPQKTAEEAINAFACDMFAQLKKQEGNLFFSPLSMAYALAFTGAGARAQTLAQMQRVLRASLDNPQGHEAFAKLMQRLNAAQNDAQVRVEMANALWPAQTFSMHTAYVEVAKKYYEAPIFPVDYADSAGAAKQINTWVEEKTKGHIRNLLNPEDINAAMRLVLTNAVYFNGRWLLPFEARQTRPGIFHAPGKEAEVPFMYQKDSFKYGQVEGLQMLELPYKGEAFSMRVLLPEDKPGALEKLEKALSPERLAQWTKALRLQEVRVVFPKLKLTWGVQDLKEALVALGMRDAFVLGKANFSGMSAEKDFLISKVLHKATLEVDEGGTVATATTAFLGTMGGMPPPAPEFRADRPFLFLILDNTKGTLLFVGRITNPLQ